MPEGAEVLETAVSLHKKIHGKILFGITVYHTSRYYKNGGIDKLKEVQFPIFINRVYSRGKKIIFDGLDVNMHEIYFVSSLAMTGTWQYQKDKHSGLELSFETFSLFFDDPRHFGSFIICLTKEQLEKALKTVGPDFLTENISFEDYNKILENRFVKKRQIAGFLLDQKYFSGIGNWVRAEVLYESRIAPYRTIESLSLEERKRLHYWSIKVLRDAYQVKGLTIQNFISPEREYGRYKVKVYGREKDPYGNPVVRDVFRDKRTMHWVPNVQK